MLIKLKLTPWLPREDFSISNFFFDEIVCDTSKVTLWQDQVGKVLAFLLVFLLQDQFCKSEKCKKAFLDWLIKDESLLRIFTVLIKRLYWNIKFAVVLFHLKNFTSSRQYWKCYLFWSFTFFFKFKFIFLRLL